MQLGQAEQSQVGQPAGDESKQITFSSSSSSSSNFVLPLRIHERRRTMSRALGKHTARGQSRRLVTSGEDQVQVLGPRDARWPFSLHLQLLRLRLRAQTRSFPCAQERLFRSFRPNLTRPKRRKEENSSASPVGRQQQQPLQQDHKGNCNMIDR